MANEETNKKNQLFFDSCFSYHLEAAQGAAEEVSADLSDRASRVEAHSELRTYSLKQRRNKM